MPTRNDYDVVVVGGGVTGTALLYALGKYTNVRRIAQIEKNARVAQVNSHPLNNAQTSHDGGTETNYDLPHAREVQRAAIALRSYVEQRNAHGLFKVTNRMVLAVGMDEVRKLEKRYHLFKADYPDLRQVGPDELREIEPAIMAGRDPNELVAAHVSDQGYAIDYMRLSECFVEDARAANPDIDLYFKTTVRDVRREGAGYVLETNNGTLTTRVVVFAAGSYSLLFAQKLGYGMQYAILPVAGSFYSGGKLLNSKVYRMQIPGMPFAAIHGDPDVLNQNDTRFGPTTKPLPLMERHHYETFWDFIRLPLVTLRGLYAMHRIIADKKLVWYVFKNTIYDLPIIGKFFFLREARVIVPNIRYRDLKLRRGVGGIRPQIVNLETRTLEMGDKTLVGHNAIFNTTPSPGASVCLANAMRDTAQVVAFLGDGYTFDKARMEGDLGLEAVPAETAEPK